MHFIFLQPIVITCCIFGPWIFFSEVKSQVPHCLHRIGYCTPLQNCIALLTPWEELQRKDQFELQLEGKAAACSCNIKKTTPNDSRMSEGGLWQTHVLGKGASESLDPLPDQSFQSLEVMMIFCIKFCLSIQKL